MNYSRLLLASLGGMVAYFAFGFVVFGMLPEMVNEYRKYPAVYRSQEPMEGVMPVGMAATFVAILVVAVLYAMLYHGGSGLAAGTKIGVLIGLFAVCGFVLHNYVNINIGLRLTVAQAIAYFAEWTIVGVVIGLIYRSAA
jgi:hypothetical protein